MKVSFLACNVLRPELECILEQIRSEGLFDCEIAVTYLQAGLHIDLDLLKNDILHALDLMIADRTILLYGSKCHPEFHEFLKDRDLITFPQSNCIELLLGARMQEIDRTSKTFYLTPGWIAFICECFLKWDEVSIRQGFGYYDRMLLLDTGVCEITDEQILDIFDHYCVPIEVEKVGLSVFKGNIVAAITQVIENRSDAQT